MTSQNLCYVCRGGKAYPVMTVGSVGFSREKPENFTSGGPNSADVYYSLLFMRPLP